MKKRNFVIVIVIFLILDLISKWLVTGKQINLINNFLSINFVKNSGALFGLFKGYNIIFILLSIIVLIIIIYMLNEFGYNFGFAVIFAGILGNFIDRIYFGYVRDFIDFNFWPVFNLADVFLVGGVLYLIYYLYFNKFKEKQ